ncbi:MAG TPA: hypothetical protein VF184_02965 [Phycisphaeraceae bacterium]
MRSVRYLNAILTVLAVLLALNLWVTWAATPGGQALSWAEPAQAAGIPNAGEQRKQMIDLLKALNVKVNQLTELVESGKVRVQVEAPPSESGRP